MARARWAESTPATITQRQQMSGPFDFLDHLPTLLQYHSVRTQKPGEGGTDDLVEGDAHHADV